MPPKDHIPETKPLDRKDLKFVEWFRKYRDIYKAAERAGIPKNKAIATFNRPEIQDELERQDEAVRMEKAKQEAADARLCNELIDRELLKLILLDGEKHGTLKLEALRLGAVMTGRIQSGNTRSLDAAEGRQGTGNFYQALVQVQEPAPILPDGQNDPTPMASEVAAMAAAAPVSPAPAAKPTNPPAAKKAEPPSKQGVVRIG